MTNDFGDDREQIIMIEANFLKHDIETPPEKKNFKDFFHRDSIFKDMTKKELMDQPKMSGMMDEYKNDTDTKSFQASNTY